MRRATYWATRARAAQLFLSTLSLRRATSNRSEPSSWRRFLSTLSLRRATPGWQRSRSTARRISIHALLAESDHARVGVAAGAVISIHALLAESDVLRQGLGSWSSYFYPRSPCGERQQFGRLCFQRQPISIHALLAESDYLSNNSRHFLRPFLSTLSLRRATQTNTGSNESGEFLSTLSLRRATNSLVRCSCTIDISIHALLAESDNFLTARFTHREISIHALLAESDAWPVGISHHRRISIHALLAESDLSLRVSIFGSPSFLSTLSLRRATMILLPCAAQATHFYPRSPCGERPVGCLVSMPPWCISIHALLAESDTRKVHDWINGAISIHALLAESDLTQDLPIWRRPYFYPRSPCGERQNHNIRIIVSKAFLSTLSLRRATLAAITSIFARRVFLSTLSLRRATRAGWQPWTVRRYFYPRSPCGERRAVSVRQHNF